MASGEQLSLTSSQKIWKILPQILPILLLSVVLPTSDVGTDLLLVSRLYKGRGYTCVWSAGQRRDMDHNRDCINVGPERFCSAEKVSSGVCGVSRHYCCPHDGLWTGQRQQHPQTYHQVHRDVPEEYCKASQNETSREMHLTLDQLNDNLTLKYCSEDAPFDHFSKFYCKTVSKSDEYYRFYQCAYIAGPDQHCTSKSSHSPCGLQTDPGHFCKNFTRWSSEYRRYHQCQTEGADSYCRAPDSNQEVCGGTHPIFASAMLLFFTLNLTMGVVTCVRLEGCQIVPLISAVLNVYPQYGKGNHIRN